MQSQSQLKFLAVNFKHGVRSEQNAKFGERRLLGRNSIVGCCCRFHRALLATKIDANQRVLALPDILMDLPLHGRFQPVKTGTFALSFNHIAQKQPEVIPKQKS